MNTLPMDVGVSDCQHLVLYVTLVDEMLRQLLASHLHVLYRTAVTIGLLCITSAAWYSSKVQFSYFSTAAMLY